MRIGKDCDSMLYFIVLTLFIIDIVYITFRSNTCCVTRQSTHIWIPLANMRTSQSDSPLDYKRLILILSRPCIFDTGPIHRSYTQVRTSRDFHPPYLVKYEFLHSRSKLGRFKF